jgi:hypothetical protein
MATLLIEVNLALLRDSQNTFLHLSLCPLWLKKPDPPMLAVRTSLRPGFRKLLTDSAEVAQKLRFVTGQP